MKSDEVKAAAAAIQGEVVKRMGLQARVCNSKCFYVQFVKPYKALE